MPLHMSVALKSQYLFVFDARLFPTNSNVKYESYYCAFQISYIFAGSVCGIALHIIAVRIYHLCVELFFANTQM